jgi:hypothetical protein
MSGTPVMASPARPASGPAGSAPTSPTLGQVWRSARGVVLVAALVLLAAAVPLLFAGPDEPEAYLDPASTSLDGAAALHRLLRDRGVEVVPTRDPGRVAGLAGPDTRVLLSRPETLTRPEVQELDALDVHLLVVGTDHSDLLLGRSGVEGAPMASLAPACALPAAVRAGSAYLGGASFPRDAGDAGCYRVGDRPTLVTAPGFTLAASGDFMTNRRLDEDGNAALALNLAGADPRLVWLLPPDRSDRALPPEAGGRSVSDLIPPQVPWAVATLVLAVLLTAVWRGRRLGPVVVEPLPVVVRAAETVEGRGRLYRARRARRQAAAALRSAATARLVARLGLPAGATPEQVVGALVDRFGQDAVMVEHLLYGREPADDPALVRLADDLDALERTVRQR